MEFIAKAFEAVFMGCLFFAGGFSAAVLFGLSVWLFLGIAAAVAVTISIF